MTNHRASAFGTIFASSYAEVREAQNRDAGWPSPARDWSCNLRRPAAVYWIEKGGRGDAAHDSAVSCPVFPPGRRFQCT